VYSHALELPVGVTVVEPCGIGAALDGDDFPELRSDLVAAPPTPDEDELTHEVS